MPERAVPGPVGPASKIQPPPDDIPPHDYAVIRSVGAMRRWEGRWWSEVCGK